MSTISQVNELPVVSEQKSLAAQPIVVDNPLPWSMIWTASIAKGVATLLRKVKVQRARKNLRVCESVSLGEKRFVAIVQVDGERFLIGGSASSVAMLTRLNEPATFAATLERCQEAGKAI